MDLGPGRAKLFILKDPAISVVGSGGMLSDSRIGTILA
jgi:hypothetical protein